MMRKSHPLHKYKGMLAAAPARAKKARAKKVPSKLVGSGRLVGGGPELSEERIAQISNDISECIYDTHTKAELRQCVKYYQQKAIEAETDTRGLISSMLQFALEQLQARKRGATPNNELSRRPAGGGATKED